MKDNFQKNQHLHNNEDKDYKKVGTNNILSSIDYNN